MVSTQYPHLPVRASRHVELGDDQSSSRADVLNIFLRLCSNESRTRSPRCQVTMKLYLSTSTKMVYCYACLGRVSLVAWKAAVH